MRQLSAAAYAGMFVFGVVMALLGAVLPSLSQRLGLGLSQASWLFVGMNASMLATSLLLGPAMDRFGMKAPMTLGPLAVGAALVGIASASGYGGLLASAALLGTGGGALNGSTNTLVADLHPDPRRKSAALNMLGMFFGFGALLLPFALGGLMDALGLSAILQATAALCAAPAVLSAVLSFPPPKQKVGISAAQVAGMLRSPLVLAMGLLLFFESGNEFLLGGYISTYLTREAGMTLASASFALSLFWAAILLARALSGRLLELLPGHRLVMASAAVAAAAAGWLLASAGPVQAVCAVASLGFGLSCIFPTTLGIAGAHFAERSGAVFGILFALALSGGMTLPWAVGQLADGYGLRAGLALSPAAFLGILAIAAAIPRLARRRTG